MSRSPQDVFQHHAEALGAGDLDGIVEDYSDDAVFIRPAGVKRGKDGIDTFIFRDGQIRLQTVRYTLQRTT
jgi:ketosteroid isomerase-like protein